MKRRQGIILIFGFKIGRVATSFQGLRDRELSGIMKQKVKNGIRVGNETEPTRKSNDESKKPQLKKLVRLGSVIGVRSSTSMGDEPT